MLMEISIMRISITKIIDENGTRDVEVERVEESTYNKIYR